MTHAVSLPVFDGPLELLLELVVKRRVEVTAVSVSRITREYLERVAARDDLDAGDTGDFLQLGARLLHIKSLALLPRAEDHTEQAVELGRLNAELLEYQRFRDVARTLAARVTSPSFGRGTREPAGATGALAPLAPEALAAAFTRVLKTLPPAPPRPGVIARVVTQAEMTARLNRRLAKGPFELQDALAEVQDRFEAVVLFVALLELVKQHLAEVMQPNTFGPITVEPARA